MSLNGLYNCITQNKGKTEYLVLVAKLQKALNYRNTSKKKKKFKKKTFNPKPDNIYVILVVRKVIGVQHIFKKKRKMT